MKTLITSLMALTLSIGAVHANDSAANLKKANALVATEAKAADNFQRLLQENKQLKERVAELGNSQAEMESTIEYNNVMYNLLNKLRSDANANQVAETEATISYQKMMATALRTLKN